jgi:clan AA aspartic protease (TIGR02281 family)
MIPELTSAPPVRTQVAMKPLSNNLFTVPIEINGAATLEFIIDSGASTVVLPANVFDALRRAGAVEPGDIIGQETSVLADGSKRDGTAFNIRSLKIDAIVLQNVRGSVTSSQGSLLLGQSFLKRFNSWSQDNASHVLYLELTNSNWSLSLRRLSDIGCQAMIAFSRWIGAEHYFNKCAA